MAEKDQLFTLENVPGKGKGLIASQSIPKGTCIISEPPLFTTDALEDPNNIEKDLGRIVRSLSKEGQRAFLSLHNNNPGSDPFSNIIRSNGYPLGPSSDIGGIFPLVARINHSCLPNAQHAWSDKHQKMLVHAVRNIEPGCELTLSYIAGGPSTERRKNIKTYFGFDCACELCSLAPEARKVSDERLQKAQKLDEAIGDPKRVRYTPDRALADCRELLSIYESEQVMDLRLPRLYYDALQICGMHSDQARVCVFAQRSRDARILCEGKDSSEAAALEKLVSKPSDFENFGVTKNWKSTLGEVPKDVGDVDFEQWLWRAKN
ncbi:hypothetical protein KC340_g2528 [Hortaea werneckii]|nr:hypothetical protein KC342_g2390 [Hortaea werneckii]KAI7104692.1 hypothetical protein KC339_g4354 [Hortaea werneckii]KAI7211906.1 hypothetical protein KC365_g14800 [Hortaea werneckii]KAI7334314.1 hypothetical protein KC340_g2528 [Hortaea werneckii]KAI7398068.1 hypothetical protein KC328_g4616 [Hortaea werneckii]